MRSRKVAARHGDGCRVCQGAIDGNDRVCLWRRPSIPARSTPIAERQDDRRFG